MLEYYLDSEFKICQLRECPASEHIDCFADWLHTAGYRRRPAQLLLRGAAHLSHWASIRKVRIDEIDQKLFGTFVHHLAACTCTHPFHGRDLYNVQGAKRFIQHLQIRGILPCTEAPCESVPALVKSFSHWMRLHRGVAESTLAQYVPITKEFVGTLGGDAAAYNASQVRDFILARASRTGHSRAKSVANATRMFLRFLATYDYCSPDLIAAVPRIAHWRLASLPRYISAQDIERLVAACSPASVEGSRDRAIILLLARLGLRAGDVRNLLIEDIDWSQGRLRVVGKGQCETRLPLPQDAGDAILHYLQHFRPAIDDDHVFLKVHAPFAPLRSSGPISSLVGRAIRRAGIKAPSMGAHLLRHSAATEMLRQGSSLDVIGAVLRHRSIESTAHYAKVDLKLLHSVAQPWPSKGGSLC